MTEKKTLLIITRPQKQSAQLLDALTKRLRRVPRSIINPLINIKDLKVDLPKSLMNPFIFTSQNAVSILAQRTSQRGDVYCVGLKVADLAKANGFNVISISETVEKMINTGLPKKCSYFRGKQITVDIASQPSIKMDEYILYAQELLEINNADNDNDEVNDGNSMMMMIAQCMHSLGAVHGRCGEYDEAYCWYEEALKRKNDIVNSEGEASDSAR